MKRSIKFRAWHTLQEKMYSASELNEQDYYVNPFNGQIFGVDQLEFIHLPELIPLQFTGFIDTEGREIYEGDIIYWIDGDEAGADVVCWGPEGAWLAVAWTDEIIDDADDELPTNHLVYREPLHNFIEEHQVIGNVFEGTPGWEISGD